MKIKTFTISVDEITDILSITDPAVRDAAIRAIRSAASDPDSIPDTMEGEAAPILHRIRRKALARARANARRQERARAKEKQAAEQQTLPPPQAESAPRLKQIPFTEKMADKLQYLKSHLSQTFDDIIYLLDKFSFGNPQCRSGINHFQHEFDYLRKIFAPFYSFITQYLSLPPERRNGITVEIDYDLNA